MGKEARTKRRCTRNGRAFSMRVASPGPIKNPPLKWHGGKWPLARCLVGLMPPHTTYVEPFAGGLAVLLSKPADDISEVVNDIDGNLTNFWRVLRDESRFASFLRIAQATPMCESIWRSCAKELKSANPVRRAVAFFVHCRQSLAGRMKSFAPLSITRTRRSMNEQCSAWLSAIEGLPAVHARLARVAILNRDAIDVIEQHDGAQSLFYCDPPYVAGTRTAPDVYAHEMPLAKHRRLLDVLMRCKGKVILSGYAHELYNRRLSGWERIEIERPNSAAGGVSKRIMTEVLWCNFKPNAKVAAAA